MKTRNILLLATGVLFIVGVALLFNRSSLSRGAATATFSANAVSPHLNTLKVEAPYGYCVIRYDMVPRSLGGTPNQWPFTVGGRSLTGDPMGLFDDATSHSTSYPDSGSVDDSKVETHVRISPKLNTAATGELPEDKAILERSGSYLFVTKDPGNSNHLESIVASWTVPIPYHAG